MNKSRSGKLPSFMLALFLLLFTATIYGQGFYNTTNWRFSSPKQFGFQLLDMDFFDNNKGIAVGANGGIAYTTDGGNKWSYGAFTYFSPAGIITSTTFQDVHFVSANVAYAVGTNGCVAKTTNGGVNWSFVVSPLFANSRNINTCWFLSETKGYIAGQSNTPDLLPKLYFTLNGGSTWDSIAAPTGGKTRVGYVNNVNVGSFLWDVTAKDKEIYRIIFVNDNLGYISGSGLSTFEPIPNVTSTVTCLPLATTTTTGSHHASLLWKFSNGTLLDYSISKERLGYNGIYNTAPNCTYKYASNSVHTNTYKAMQILDDTTVLLVSSNNNISIRVSTGPNSFTPNINNGNALEPGKYTLLNAPSPPQNNTNVLGAPIPANPVFSFLNPMNFAKASNGKLFLPVLSATFGPQTRVMTTTDKGVSWQEESWLPAGRNYSTYGGQAIDILPSGKFFIAGQNGVIADSTSGSPWRSNYVQYTMGGPNKMDWADCNNGGAAGGAVITRTDDGGKTWTDIVRTDFQNLNININSFAYVPNDPSRAYFATTVGTVYKATNLNTNNPSLDPSIALAGHQMFDVATVGSDSVWACGYLSSGAATNSKVVRSFNGGLTWTIVNSFSTGSTAQLFRHIEFPTRLVGYVAGTRDTIWKTTDAGVTWTKLPTPTSIVTPQITYTDMYALDANTVFLVGNGFPRKVVFRTTDGGNTWTDITGNILAIMPVSNLNSIVFHDINNGYVGANGAILVTNDGGINWRLDVEPSSTNNVSIAFSPKRVPAGTPFVNRRLFAVGVFANHILEYGDTTKLNVSSAEALVASCTNVNNGSITVTATGGIAPYTYRLNGGTPQVSNVFNNVAPGVNTITINDFACGVYTKSINVPSRPAPRISAGPDRVIIDGDAITLNGGNISGTPATISWTPTSGIISGGNSFAPVVKPQVTTTFAINVTDVNGCTGTDNALVTVIPYCIKVWNAFTPNGDGINDKWLVTNGAPCYENIEVAVYNRYGSEVYHNAHYNNDWDGTYKGSPVPDGTYYYIVKVRLINGQIPVLKGDVTILR
ncbi:MAG: gliding motility-associated C-terminal domain-containing protein [Chitinophagaceae bacterium]|nr:gliding motility-associated C-terminal domain-containing protein [Chitinophagaceae bacterium]